MPVSVILRVSCDVFLAKKGGTIKKKCGRHDEFETPSITYSIRAAHDAGWVFDTTGKKDKAMCPDCGPHIRPHMYRNAQR